MSDICGLCGIPMSEIHNFLEHMTEYHYMELQNKLSEFIVSEVDI